MEESYPLSKNNPLNKTNILSKSFFFWMRKIAYKGNTKGLDVNDLYKTYDKDRSSKVTNQLEMYWEQELEKSKIKGKNPSLTRAILKAYFWEYVFYGLILFINFAFIRCMQPLCLQALIKLFNSDTKRSESTIDNMIIYGSLVCILTFFGAFLQHHSVAGSNLVGMRIRVAVSSMVYRKILRLSQRALHQTAAGQVVNLLSNDVQRFDLVAQFIHFFWITPIQVAIISYLMYNIVGISSLSGIGFIIITTVPFQSYLGKITSKYRLQVAKRTDYRVRIMSEILSGVQVIKMYAWEKPFQKVVALARRTEVKALTKASYVRGVLVSFMVFIERASLAVTVITYVILDHEITADLVFSLSVFFNLLQMTLAIMYPIAISQGAETLVSIGRLQDFLLMEEKETSKIGPSKDNSIKLKHVEASWVPPNPTLRAIDLVIQPGTLCAIVGPVGSGKSSMLKLLLGELLTASGNLEISGDISYASQEPWLFASTVKNNILFGQEFDKLHYRNVVKACALERDFEQFTDGDKTAVGDRGVSLSGGQRARINLARCVYKDADIYLLDDPLSAVDTKVGKHLFDQCITGFLRGKTRILVTHQLQFLKKADKIVVLNKGCIEAQGTFQELSKSTLDFTKLLVAADETTEAPETAIKRTSFSRSVSMMSSASFVSSTVESQYNDTESNGNGAQMEQIGLYKGNAFFDYIGAFGSCCKIACLITILILCQVILSGADYWITFWTSQEAIRHTAMININTTYLSQPDALLPQDNLQFKTLEVIDSENPDSYYTYVPAENKTLSENLTLNQTEIINSIQDVIKSWTDVFDINGSVVSILKTEVCMYIYCTFIITAIILTVFRSSFYFHSCMQASKKLHDKMFGCLLEAPMRFFDTNPAGRVLNRFSKDMGAIDEMLPKALIDVIQILLVMTGILVMVIISNSYLIVIIIILGFVFFKVRKWYVATARSIKHIEGVTKSPVFSFISSSIDGLTTIRATKIEDTLKRQFDDHQDVHTSAWYLTVYCTVAFGLWLDLLCVLFVFCVVFGFILLNEYTNIEGSFVGLAISQSLILVGMLQYGMKQIAEVVNYLTSVERVLEYTQLEREHPLETTPENAPPSGWPSKGKILFDRMYLRYAPDADPVLKNLNIQIIPTEKVGIVGRTGAGKSSLISALFRLAPIEGDVIIDGINTATVGLKDLRRKISIIPQEPVLFSASMRYNLDPFTEFDDQKLWAVLEEVELKDKINSLDFMVTEGGSNFSLGERQLICLARAILRNNKILILDEATANVDPRTDELIQKTIRKKFMQCTVLTIAHRLNTIMDSDKVLVMDAGRMVEFDHPHTLLQMPDSYFHKMLVETGPTMTQNLKEVALQAYQKKFGGI